MKTAFVSQQRGEEKKKKIRDLNNRTSKVIISIKRVLPLSQLVNLSLKKEVVICGVIYIVWYREHMNCISYEAGFICSSVVVYNGVI